MTDPIWRKVMISLEANYACAPEQMPPLDDLRYRADAAARAVFGLADAQHACVHVYTPEVRAVRGAKNQLLTWLCAQRGIDADDSDAVERELSGVLDTLVHDVASRMASDVNNGGLGEQLAWLVRQGLDERDLANELGD